MVITKLGSLDRLRDLEDPFWILLRHCYTRGAPFSPRKMVDLQIHSEHRSAGQLGNWSAALTTTVLRKLDQGLRFHGLGDPLQILL